MNDSIFPGGVWPVMLTPFQQDNRVDYGALGELVQWYMDHGASGLFAVCQSSEMFFLSLEERIGCADFVRKKAAGKLPVIASGHISDSFEDQRRELLAMAGTGVDATILITNRLALQTESDEVWLSNLKKLLKELPKDVKLGLYECPYPYKRVLSPELTRWCADSGRFYFLKDTSCDIGNISAKLQACRNTPLKLYNANTATLLESLKLGAYGYSGVMANMQCSLYTYLCRSYQDRDLTPMSDLLTICALIERQLYPANAKYYLQQEGLHISTKCRVQNDAALSDTFQKEIHMLRRITKHMENQFLS